MEFDVLFIIAGVDPGITVGYAIIDLNGKVVKVGSLREGSEEDVIRIISCFGTPSLVAGDTAPPAGFVSKIAARFNVRLFHPRKSMTIEEKRHIAKEILNPHMRDACAAAIKAYRKYANRLRQIEKMKRKNSDELKHLLIQGKAIGKFIKK